MLDQDVETIAARVPGTIVTQSKAPGLFFFTNSKYPKQIALGANGIVVLNRKQAKTLANELLDVLELYCGE